MRVTAIGLVGLLMLAGLLGPLPTSAQVPEKIPRIGVLALGAADGSVALVMIGLVLGRSPRAGTRERAWEAQAIGLGGLAIAWLGGLASRGHL